MASIGPNRNTLPAKVHENHDLKETVEMMRCTRYSGLPLAARLLLKEIIDRCGWHGDELACYPSEETLCLDTGIDSATTLCKFLDLIEAAGFIRRRHRTSKGVVVDNKRDASGRWLQRYYILRPDSLNELNAMTAEEKRERQMVTRANKQSTRNRVQKLETVKTAGDPPDRLQNDAKTVSNFCDSPSPFFEKHRLQKMETNVPNVNDSQFLNVPQANDAGARENFQREEPSDDLGPSSDVPKVDHALGENDPKLRRLQNMETVTESAPPPPPPPPQFRPTPHDKARLEASKVRPPCIKCGQSSELLFKSHAATYICPLCKIKARSEKERAFREKRAS